MNKVILSGCLCKDIELRKTPNGLSVANATIAVTRENKDANGTTQTDFINIVLWGQSAEYINKYGQDSPRVELCGRMQNRTYQLKDGSNRTITEVQVDYIKVISKSKVALEKQNKIKEEKENIGILSLDDELPF